MTDTIKIKGHHIKLFNQKLASYRRAIQIQNNIHTQLKKLSVHEDDIEIEIPKLVSRNKAATIEWWQNGHYLNFNCSQANSFIANLDAISKVLTIEVQQVLNQEKRIDEFCNIFSEDDDIFKQRKNARITLGLNEDCQDLELINKAYKKMAMKHHPDRPDGSIEIFKKINKAHKILKRELE